MKERPILFSTAMVQAILEGLKTVTRRVIIPQPDPDSLHMIQFTGAHPHVWPYTRPDGMADKCQYGEPGDLLWVRETWRPGSPLEKSPVYYKAGPSGATDMKWKPSIHMPKKYARIWLKVTNVRVERINDIGQGNACKEGCPKGLEPIEWFSVLWDDLNKFRGFGWGINPWVWVVEFELTDRPN